MLLAFQILISCIAGIFANVLVYRLVIAPLVKARNTCEPKTTELVGLKASVTADISFDEFGEIRYVLNRNSFASPAKATNRGQIKAGKDVVICWIEDDIFYVASLNDIEGQETAISADLVYDNS